MKLSSVGNSKHEAYSIIIRIEYIDDWSRYKKAR